MATTYRHTQPGYTSTGAIGAGLLFAAAKLLKGGPAALSLLPVVGVLGGVAVVVSSFTIEIRDGTLRSWFGPGLPAKTVPVRDIESVEAVTNPWYYGWGIRVTPHGMLYNVSGREAVQIRTRNGTTFRLGTDEPHALVRAILEERGARSEE